MQREEGNEFDEVVPDLLSDVFRGDAFDVLLDELRESLFLDDFDSFDELPEFPELFGQIGQVLVEVVGVLDLALLVFEANALLNVELKRIVEGFELFLDLVNKRGLFLADVGFLELLNEFDELPGLFVQVVESVNVFHFHFVEEEDEFLEILDDVAVLHAGLGCLVKDLFYLLRRELLQPVTPVYNSHSSVVLVIHRGYELANQLERAYVVFAPGTRNAFLAIRLVLK